MELLQEKVGAQWCSTFYMLRGKRAIRYLLLHFTNKDIGRNLMKDTMWKVAPEDGYFARKDSDISHGQLLLSEPDLSPVEKWVRQELHHAPRRWHQLHKAFLPEIWREVHLNKTLKKLIKNGLIVATGKPVKASNPLLTLKEI